MHLYNTKQKKEIQSERKLRTFIMTEKLLHIPFPVIVEGKYDKIRLSGVIDAPIITTDGFALFRDKRKLGYLRKLCDSCGGVVIFTDSDGAGLLIRSYLRTALGSSRKVYNLYSPRVEGKERRKSQPSKEGILGVEGIASDTLRNIFTVFMNDPAPGDRPEKRIVITKAQFFSDGLSGGEESRKRRRELCIRLGLPDNISAGALLEAINLLGAADVYNEFIDEYRENSSEHCD